MEKAKNSLWGPDKSKQGDTKGDTDVKYLRTLNNFWESKFLNKLQSLYY